jgi:predicted ATPase
MSDSVNEFHQRFRVAVRARESGRYTYQIFTIAGEPRTFRSDNQSYDTPDEAERAGYEAVAVLKVQPKQ